MSNVSDFIAELRTTAWRTQSARFNAARRLKRRDTFGALSIGGFAALGVGVTVVQKVYGMAGTPVDNYLTALSICLGLFVIVISLVEWGIGGAVRAELLHQNARELSAYQRKLYQVILEMADGKVLGGDEAARLREEYERIKEGCAYNHEPVDDLLFLVQKRFDSNYEDLFKRKRPSLFTAAWIHTLSFLSVVWYFGLFWIAILVFVLVTLWPICETN